MSRGMTKSIVILAAAVLLILMNGVADAQKLTVGDATGWTLPPSAGFYDSWAAKQNFVVGNTLVFDFTTGVHTVAVVTSKEAYDKCDASLDDKAETATEGPFEKTLTTAGQYYFLCTVGNHCDQGQKFAVTASDGSSPAASTPTESPPTDSSASALSIFSASSFMAVVLALLY